MASPLAAVADAVEPVPEKAAIASAHPLATQAGMDILAAGGNAFDAAVAVSAALAVVEPAGSGLGGGGFWLLDAAGPAAPVVVDGREVAPGAATRDMYLDEAGEPIPRASVDGPLAAGIPGSPAALEHIAARYGKLPLSQSLQPAIRLARDGYPASERLVAGLRYKETLLNRWPAAAKVYLRDGKAPQVGETIKNPDLAKTLTAIADRGADGFYKGRVARRLVRGARAAGGIWTLDDLANYEVRERAPLQADFGDYRIVTAPPPSAGGVALINALHILDGYRMTDLDSTTQKHLVVEAMRRAFRDRAAYLGDPDFVDVPVKRLTHRYYAEGQRTSINIDRATASASLPGVLDDANGGTQTTHFSVLDRDGNMVAATMSINFWFGSGFMAPGTGVLLNNEMDDFSIKPGVPNGYELIGADANAIAPGKRMLSSMTPTIVSSNEHGHAILGTPGGSRIISMVLLGTLGFLDGLDASEMVALPRYHHQYMPDSITYERAALSEAEQKTLQAFGHKLRPSGRNYGNLQVITWDPQSGEVEAASDPRGEGAGRVY
ncbi:MAG: gamma-glutamyltransferase [Gammaproteobacteria bacterium]|nr:gamma-glutamyltransferase [Gammaproteobacteria bacterium]